MSMAGYNYQINYKGSSKVIKRIVDRLNHLMDTILGTTHDTAFYGDLGQIAYEHSQQTGNTHGLTLSDLGIAELPRQVELLAEAIGSIDHWVDHAEVQFVDHDGDEFVFQTGAQLLAYH